MKVKGSSSTSTKMLDCVGNYLSKKIAGSARSGSMQLSSITTPGPLRTSKE
jgi:hypothetical protein